VAAAACRHVLWLCWASDVAVSAFPATDEEVTFMMEGVFLPLIMNLLPGGYARHMLLQPLCLVLMIGI